VYVVETDAEGLFGVGSCGPAFHGEIPADGEITALYLLPEAQGMGIGRSLLAWMAEDLAGRGFASAGLLVLTPNAPARRFYEALGGRAVGEVQSTHDDHDVGDTIYVWDDIDVLRIR
jgi:ribosomal protein S18 acetylase RimI-like enzyme